MTTPTLDTLYADHLQTMIARADAALARAGLDHLVVPSGVPAVQVFDDRVEPFTANPQFKAWLPVTDAPGSWLVHTPGRRPTVVFLQPHDYWHVVPASPGGAWTTHMDVVVIRSRDEALPQLPDPARSAILGAASSALGAVVPNNPAAVLDYLHYHRAFKTPYELAQMRLATRRAVRGHRAAERAWRAGASEYGIHLAYCQASGQEGMDLPYDNIIAANEHAAVLHYTDRDRVPAAARRSFLIDAGASAAGYAADITRTYAADAEADFTALVSAVDAVQQALCARVLDGVDYRRIHLESHQMLAGVLRDAGLVRCSPEAAVATGISSAFFPHGIGHGIGLQTHEVAGFAASDAGGTLPKPDGHPYLRLTRTLAPGMVVTIEPGIYFIGMLLQPLRAGPHADKVDWAQVEALAPCGGVRIEDNVVCTAAGPVNLTREAFAAQAA
jgi:Xaa-Pro dipeptidase